MYYLTVYLKLSYKVMIWFVKHYKNSVSGASLSL